MIRDTKVTELREHMRGGDGAVTIINYLDKDEKPANLRLVGILEVPPGASIGVHKHENEAEVFHILAGEGEYSDNGIICAVKAGDTTLCPDGCEHGIKNTGAETLIINAIIVLS